jgi:hypothetical protein
VVYWKVPGLLLSVKEDESGGQGHSYVQLVRTIKLEAVL